MKGVGVMSIDSRLLFVPVLALASHAEEEPTAGVSVGAVLPQGSTRGVLGCRAGGLLLGCHLGKDFDGGHALRLGFAMGVANGGGEGRTWAPGTHSNFNSYRLGLDYLYYPFKASRGPFLLVGAGGLRLRTRAERWVPADSAECLKRGQTHPMGSRLPLAPGFVPEKRDRKLEGTSVGVQECGTWDSHPIADTGVRLGISAGVGFSWKRTWEVAIRCDGVQAFGHTLTVIGITASARF
jgi:hypothetical protein